MAFVYICLPDLQRGRPRWALIASETPVSPTSQVHMFRIVDSKTSTANTVNFLLEETSTLLGLLSNGDYVGAIYIGHTTEVVESHQEFVDYIKSSAGINRPGKPDWDNAQWLSDLVGSMTMDEGGILDVTVPVEGAANDHAKFLKYLEEDRIPALMSQPLGFGNIVPLVPGVAVPTVGDVVG